MRARSTRRSSRTTRRRCSRAPGAEEATTKQARNKNKQLATTAPVVARCCVWWVMRGWLLAQESSSQATRCHLLKKQTPARQQARSNKKPAAVAGGGSSPLLLLLHAPPQPLNRKATEATATGCWCLLAVPVRSTVRGGRGEECRAALPRSRASTSTTGARQYPVLRGGSARATPVTWWCYSSYFEVATVVGYRQGGVLLPVVVVLHYLRLWYSRSLWLWAAAAAALFCCLLLVLVKSCLFCCLPMPSGGWLAGLPG